MASLTIQPIKSTQHGADFFSLKRVVYQSDPAVVIPLHRMERQQVDRQQNPFFQHAEMEALICYRDQKPVGRIAAIVDRLHQEFHQDTVGFFGFFETVDDPRVVDALVQRASEWLNERDCLIVRGSVNPSMKSDFGVLVEGNKPSPFVMMAHTPSRYE